MPTGAMTMLEAAKTIKNPKERGIVMTYALAYHPLTAMPIETEPTGQFRWNVDEQLPYTSGGTRAINGSWTATRANVAPFSSTAKIYGGEVKVDRYINEVNPGRVAHEKQMQIAARAYMWTKDMFEGAGGNDLRGIKDWIDNETLFANQNQDLGSSSAGYRLMTDDLDKLLSMLDVVPGRTFIYCSDNIGLRCRKLQRGNQATGDIGYLNQHQPSQWGYFSGNYAGVPIVVLKDGKGTDLLSTTDGDGSSTVVYGVTYGPSAFTGFQTSGPKVIPLTNNDVYNYFDMEWYVGIVPQSIRCIARLRYVKNSV